MQADPQRTQVYRAESLYREIGAGHTAVPDYPTAQRFAARVVASAQFGSRWPDAHRLLSPPPDASYEAVFASGYEELSEQIVGAADLDRSELARLVEWVPIVDGGGVAPTGLRLGRHDGPTLGGARGLMWITLNLSEDPTEGVVVHEVAHLVTVAEFGEDRDDHGPEFARTLLAVAELAHGPVAARQLRDGFIAHQVRWQPSRDRSDGHRDIAERDAEQSPSRRSIEGF